MAGHEQQGEPEQTGIRINYEFNTSFPNFAFRREFWTPKAGGRKPSADAALVYLWCLDKVTEVYTQDGVRYGAVLGGKRIGFKVIAGNLGVAWNTVQRNMKHLEGVGLIRRFRGSNMQEYSYEVVNCRRVFNGKQADGSIKHKGKTYKRRVNGEVPKQTGQSSFGSEEGSDAPLSDDPPTSVQFEDDDELA